MKPQHGLIPQKYQDHRDYSYPRTFGTVAGAQLDAEVNYDAGLLVRDQLADGMPYGCTGETTADIGTDLDHIIYDPLYVYTKTCALEGHPTNQGCQGKNARKVARTLGLLAVGEPENQAIVHLRGQDFNIHPVGKQDWFDAARSALVQNHGQSISVESFWPHAWWPMGVDGICPGTVTYVGDESWHNWSICGITFKGGEWKLIGKAWQGTGFGDNGKHYFGRTEMNQLMSVSGCALWVQAKADPADIQRVQVDIITKMISVIRNLLSLWGKKSLGGIQVSRSWLENQIALIKAQLAKLMHPTETLIWTDPVNARHAVRVRCDNAGLTWDEKNIISRCVRVESGFDNNAICRNRTKDGTIWSSDWGLVQVNDRYHCGPGSDFPSAQYVVDHPQEAIDWMIRMFKAGQISMWVSYSSGAYLKVQP